MTRAAILFSFALTCLSLAGCTTDQPGMPASAEVPVALEPPVPATTGLPTGLPVDGVQPWEDLDAGGHVVPRGRAASSINIDTDFTPGVERFMESGDAADNLEATRLNGTDDSGTSYAMYRVSMGAEQPGIVSVDANLLSGNGYYVGISDYGMGRWDWHGPFTDNHLRLEAMRDSSSELTSAFGNTFITVLCPAGSSVDVVGIGINQYDIVDITAPAVVSGFSATSVSGGLLLEWSPVLDSDLAGYALYHSDRSFISRDAAGVRRVQYLEGSTRHLLSGTSGRTYVAVSAVDFAGNEGPLSGLMDSAPLAGDPGGLVLQAEMVSGGINSSIQLSATGAASYDWDLDGDGVFEIGDDNSGLQAADTSATGIIRPRVRASDGEAVALGGLSLIITGNSRPVASATANPQSGIAPLTVVFMGTAEDAEDDIAAMSYAWDYDGDGVYEDGTDSLLPPFFDYVYAGLYNARFRVTDSEGAWDVDTVAVSVAANQTPVAGIAASRPSGDAPFRLYLDASASFDPDGEIVKYDWDTDGSGAFELTTGDQPFAQTILQQPGEYPVSVRVTDDRGASSIASVGIVARGWREVVVDTGSAVGSGASLAVIDGHPAIAYAGEEFDYVHYVRSTTRNGQSPGHWQQIVTLDAYPGTGLMGGDTSLKEVNGRPAVMYKVSEPVTEVRYLRSKTDSGSSQSDWPSPVIVDTAGEPGGSVDMEVVDGNPAAAYHDGDKEDLVYIRSTTPDGGDAADWSQKVLVDTTGSTGTYCSLAVIAGNPAIMYSDFDSFDLVYARSSTASGSQPADWASQSVVDGGASFDPDLQVVNGYPAVAYTDNGSILYRISSTVDAGGALDWSSAVTVADFSGAMRNPSLAVFNGRPAIGFGTANEDVLMLGRSDSSEGMYEFNWELEQVDSSSIGITSVSLAEVDGRPAMAYRRDFDELVYAILF